MYDPDERINKLADEFEEKAAPVSRLTLFSPCKVVTALSLMPIGFSILFDYLFFVGI